MSNILNSPYPGMEKNSTELYKFLYELYVRSGGATQSAPDDLEGLAVSAKQLNTLINIRTDTTVQNQLDTKANLTGLGTMALQDANNVAISGGALSSVSLTSSSLVGTTITGSSISSSVITIPVGLLALNLGATLAVDTTEVGNVGVGEDTLISYTLASNTLIADTQHLEIYAWGTTAANANNKTVKLYLGSTLILQSAAAAVNNVGWSINARLVRTGAAAQQSSATLLSNNSSFAELGVFASLAEDLTADLDIYCTGEATSDDDIIQKGLIIKWFNT